MKKAGIKRSVVFAAIAIGLVLALNVSAEAAVTWCRWNGADGANWNDANDWSNSVPNTYGENAVFDSGNDVLADLSTTIGRLKFESNSDTTLLNPATGTTTLELRGDDQAGDTAVTVDSGSAGRTETNVALALGRNGTGGLKWDIAGWMSVKGGITDGPTGTILRKTGSGTLAISQTTCTYSGDTKIEGGKIALYDSNRLPSGTDLIMSGGTTFDMNVGSGRTQTVASLAGAGTVDGGNLLSGSMLTISGSGSAGFAGVITGGNMALAIGGTAVQTLSGANTYAGTTTVGSGSTLLVTGTHTGAGDYTVSGTLGGTGSIDGNVTVAASGTIAAGASIGTLTVTGDLTLSGTTEMEIDGDTLAADLITGVDTLTYGGTLKVILDAGTLGYCDTFDLFDATTFAGSFDSYDLPDLDAGLSWDTSGLGTGGTIHVVPEPTTMGLIVMGGLGLLLRRRRRA